MCGKQLNQRTMQLQLQLLLLLVLGSQCIWGHVVSCATEAAADAMDVSKSPCENFHEHACGNWHAPYELRALGAHDMRSKLRALNKQLLVRHLEASGGDQDQLHTFYDSCMSGRQSLHVYMDAVQQLVPDWPLLNNATRFDWSRGSAAVRRFGAQGLWRLLVQPNWQAAEQLIFYLLPPSFKLLGNSEQSEFLYQRYLKYLLLELRLRVRRAATLAEQLVSFERQLRKLTPPPLEEAQTLVLHEPQTLQQLASQLPQLQLLDYFRLLLGERYTSQLLLVADTGYLQRLQGVLHAADPLVLSSWLLLQLPAHFELHLHEDTTLAAQREHCLQQLNQLLPRQLSQLQQRLLHGSDAAASAFRSRTQRQLQLLFDSLKAQFEVLLNATPIFEQDAATQTLALQKLRAMRLLLPPPPSPQQLEQRDEGKAQRDLQSTSFSYDTNLLHLSQAESDAQFQLALDCLQLPCESSATWSGHALGPLDVNVYYRLKLNAIELPLGLLRPPLLPSSSRSSCEANAARENSGATAPDADVDAESQARLLGGLGYMLGHELIHGFDYDGINYDAAGRVAGGQWPARAIIRFGLRAGCYLGARYSNATLTINENIADSEGLRLAYEAYRHQQPANASMRPFFVAFAQNWCGQEVASSSGAQQHASHRERVNNVLGNFPEFAEAFECKVGSLMHPPDKCRIW
ncbi:neprilysin-1 [Drosophila virilis]|uniref:Uncharacterized protein n=1 Tax=Drosophila virilis TaxID=7244 RepID=B4M761_DROVI|nr:neprilysin-1 [Drosophila virilis]EDW62628.2 uncharacterized protein Dvir_GJ16513 [Drosophila virilis]